MPSEACSEELDALLAIFLDDINVVQNNTNEVLVSMVLYPSTGDDTESKYVTLTLELLLPPEYPDVVPKITIRNPRGLSEEMLNQLTDDMKKKCEEILGCSMVFELIDMGREFLTKNNRPSAECPICLLSFAESDVFFRPSCFHHVHSFCLGKYLYSVSQSLLQGDQLPNESVPAHCCPVCRNEFTEEIDIQKLLAAPPPAEDSPEGVVTPYVPEDWLGKRESLNKLFAKQKSQGGIIDLSEKDKKLIVISSPARNDTSENNGSGSSSTGSSMEETTSSSSSLPPNHSTDHQPHQHHPHYPRGNNSRQPNPSRNKPQQHNHHHQPRQQNRQQQQQQQPSSFSSTATESSRSQGHNKDTNSCPHYRHRRRK